MQYKAIKTRLYLEKNDKIFLRMLMHSAKSLYNQALYNVRQYYIANKEYLTYEENYKLLSKTSEHYRMLNTSQGQTIIRKVDEVYTSKSSYIDKDDIPELNDSKKTSFSGKRTKRGLYVSKNGIPINADLNAALNILRKGKPDAIWIGSKGWNTPKRTYLFSS